MILMENFDVKDVFRIQKSVTHIFIMTFSLSDVFYVSLFAIFKVKT